MCSLSLSKAARLSVFPLFRFPTHNGTFGMLLNFQCVCRAGEVTLYEFARTHFAASLAALDVVPPTNGNSREREHLKSLLTYLRSSFAPQDGHRRNLSPFFVSFHFSSLVVCRLPSQCLVLTVFLCVSFSFCFLGFSQYSPLLLIPTFSFSTPHFYNHSTFPPPLSPSRFDGLPDLQSLSMS